jgi:hypothetical protein
VRRFAAILVAGLALVGCGSSMHTSTSGSTADAEAQIRSAYEQFFSSQTSLADRVAVLQNGPRFKKIVASFAGNPLAKNVHVKISSVQLEGGNQAKVVYTVTFGGTSLGKTNGTAVRENGTWKVGFASLCKLVALAGSTPSACNS